VGSKPDIRRSKPMLVVNVTIAQPANGNHFASLVRAMFANELSHWPRLERRTASAQVVGEMAEQHPNQLALAIPEAGEQLSFFFGREQVGRESRQCGFGNNFGRLSGSLTPGGLHGGLSQRTLRYWTVEGYRN
jgi:hypothetical protein